MTERTWEPMDPRTKRLEFSDKTKREAFELRDGICPGLIEIKLICSRPLAGIVEYDHIMRCEIKPDNSLANCRPLCPTCHAIKTVLDAKAAKKGRLIRKETKKSRRPKAKIQNRGFPSPEERKRIQDKYARQP